MLCKQRRLHRLYRKKSQNFMIYKHYHGQALVKLIIIEVNVGIKVHVGNVY